MAASELKFPMKGLAPEGPESKACFNRVLSQFDGLCADFSQSYAGRPHRKGKHAVRDPEIRGVTSACIP
jgi:hypothetical protein